MPQEINFTMPMTVAGTPSSYIVTPWCKIHDFTATPTIVASTANWSKLNVVANAVVSVPAGVTVTYDVVSDVAVKTVAIQPGGTLTFRGDIPTRLTLQNLLVMQGGTLNINSVSLTEIVFADLPLDTVFDPEQYGGGLIALGNVNITGATKTSWLRLAVEPLHGATTLTLSSAPAGWNVGDKLLLPDSRQLIEGEYWGLYVPQWERPTIAAISGAVVTLTAPLLYDHPAARNGDGVVVYQPHCGNLTRNVVFRSANPGGHRGHTFFHYRADSDVRYAEFRSLGRSTNAGIDNTTFNPDGSVAHIGSNQAARLPVNFHHCPGPYPVTKPQQFRLTGCSVWCGVDPMPFIWGANVLDSHFGLVEDNVVHNWNGAGILTWQGNETQNVIQRNLVVGVRGTHDSRNNDGLDASGILNHGFNNRIRNNVVSSINCSAGGIVAGIAYNQFAEPAANATAAVPNFPGADTSNPSQYTLTVPQYQPILEFTGNEAYGAMATAISLWRLGTSGYDFGPGSMPQSFVDLDAWHFWEEAFFAYPVNNVVFQLDCYGHPRGFGSPLGPYGWTSGDYWSANCTVQNSHFEGLNGGVVNCRDTPGSLTIRNCSFRNYGANINIGTIATPGSRAETWVPNAMPRTITIYTCTFAPYPGQPSFVTIMANENRIGGDDYIAQDRTLVINYNGVLGDNFQLYYPTCQAASFIVPQTTFYGTPPLVDVRGSPVAGLTNTANLAQYGLCIAGAITPANAHTRTNIIGLVVP